MAIGNFPNKGKYKIGDVLRTLIYDQGDEQWEHTYYEIIDKLPGHMQAFYGIYKLRKVVGDGNIIAMNVKFFDQCVMSCYGNTKDGTLDPAFKVLYGQEE